MVPITFKPCCSGMFHLFLSGTRSNRLFVFSTTWANQNEANLWMGSRKYGKRGANIIHQISQLAGLLNSDLYTPITWPRFEVIRDWSYRTRFTVVSKWVSRTWNGCLFQLGKREIVTLLFHPLFFGLMRNENGLQTRAFICAWVKELQCCLGYFESNTKLHTHHMYCRPRQAQATDICEIKSAQRVISDAMTMREDNSRPRLLGPSSLKSS